MLLVDHGSLLGNMHKSEIGVQHLRVPFHFGNQPIISNRLVLDNLIPLKTGKDYTWPDEVLDEMFNLVSGVSLNLLFNVA